MPIPYISYIVGHQAGTICHLMFERAHRLHPRHHHDPLCHSQFAWLSVVIGNQVKDKSLILGQVDVLNFQDQQGTQILLKHWNEDKEYRETDTTQESLESTKVSSPTPLVG